MRIIPIIISWMSKTVHLAKAALRCKHKIFYVNHEHDKIAWTHGNNQKLLLSLQVVYKLDPTFTALVNIKSSHYIDEYILSFMTLHLCCLSIY